MQRPTGVTILAVLAFIGAGLLVVGALFSLLGGMLVSTMGASRMGMLAGVGAAVIAVFLLIAAAVDIVVGVGCGSSRTGLASSRSCLRESACSARCFRSSARSGTCTSSFSCF